MNLNAGEKVATLKVRIPIHAQEALVDTLNEALNCLVHENVLRDNDDAAWEWEIPDSITCKYALRPSTLPEGFDPACHGPIGYRHVFATGIHYFCVGHGEAHRAINPFSGNLYERIA